MSSYCLLDPIRVSVAGRRVVEQGLETAPVWAEASPEQEWARAAVWAQGSVAERPALSASEAPSRLFLFRLRPVVTGPGKRLVWSEAGLP